MFKRTIIASVVILAAMLLAELLNPWPACQLFSADWWRCVEWERAAQRAEERAARLDAIEHGE